MKRLLSLVLSVIALASCQSTGTEVVASACEGPDGCACSTDTIETQSLLRAAGSCCTGTSSCCETDVCACSCCGGDGGESNCDSAIATSCCGGTSTCCSTEACACSCCGGEGGDASCAASVAFTSCCGGESSCCETDVCSCSCCGGDGSESCEQVAMAGITQASFCCDESAGGSCCQ